MYFLFILLNLLYYCTVKLLFYSKEERECKNAQKYLVFLFILPIVFTYGVPYQHTWHYQSAYTDCKVSLFLEHCGMVHLLYTEYQNTYIYIPKKKDIDRREGKGCRCCLGDRIDSIPCHTTVATVFCTRAICRMG